MNKFKKILSLMGLFSFLICQFAFVDVEMDLTQIRDSEKQFIKSLPEDIKSYYEMVNYNSDVEDLELEIYVKLILESVPRTGNERTVRSQILFTNHIDQTYYTRSAQFAYSSGVNLSYNTSFHSLRSILDFYALLFLGSEMDIWSDLGGQIYFTLAEEITNSGQDSDYSEGWDSRQQYIEDLLYFKEFRKSKFSFFQALDKIYAEESSLEEQIISLKQFYDVSMEIPDYMMETKYVRNFFKAYSEEIAKQFNKFKLLEELQEFQFLDSENKTIYQKYLSD